MRVLYIIDSLAPGGAEQSLAAVAPIHVAHGIVLDIAYLHEREGLHAELQRAGANLFPITHARGRVGCILALKRLAAQRHPDLMHTTLFEADLAGRVAATLARVPVVTSLVNVNYGPTQLKNPGVTPGKLRAARLADVLTSRRVVRWHAISGHVAREMAVHLRIPAERIDVVPRGRDPGQLGRRTQDRRASARSRLDLDTSTLVVLAAARHEAQKGLDVLIDAFAIVAARVPEARLFIAGREGNQTKALKAQAERSPASRAIRFLGTRDDVPDLLCAADVFALPSRWEGLGSVLIEALALEAPIVASDLPAVRETVTEDCGTLVPPEEPPALAEAITRVLTDTGAATARAEIGRRRFLESFSAEKVAERMEVFYRRALAGPAHAGNARP